jgi:hypothetical protein
MESKMRRQLDTKWYLLFFCLLALSPVPSTQGPPQILSKSPNQYSGRNRLPFNRFSWHNPNQIVESTDGLFSILG